jgi:hypothetical protein
MTILANPSVIYTQGAGGAISTCPGQCCDPCGCVPQYGQTTMPATLTLSTPWGNVSGTKTTTNQENPVHAPCWGRCVTFPDQYGNPIPHLLWDCSYQLTGVRQCSVASRPLYLQCSNVMTGNGWYRPEFSYCLPATRTETLEGTAHGVWTTFTAGRPATSVWTLASDGNIRIRQRVNCATGVWEYQVTLQYLRITNFGYWWQWTATNVVTSAEPAPCSYSTTVTGPYQNVTNWCQPFSPDGGIPPSQAGTGFPFAAAGPFFRRCDNVTTGGDGSAAKIYAATGWRTFTGFNAPMTFPTSIGGLDNHNQNFNGFVPPSGYYSVKSFLAPTTPVPTRFWYCATVPGFSAIQAVSSPIQYWDNDVTSCEVFGTTLDPYLDHTITL